VLSQKLLNEVCDAVCSDRVHADDNKRERPFLKPFTSISQLNAARNKKQMPPLKMVQDERPNPFHYRANVRVM